MPETPKISRRVPGYLVHLFTASGGVLGLFALHEISNNSLKYAFVWMGLAVLVDAFDGFLARKVKVAERTPEIDGALLDMIVDYFTYVIVPAFLLIETTLLPVGWKYPIVLALILVSGIQFSHREAKTEDNFFRGFPCYWNIIAFYLVVMNMPQALNAAIICFFLLLTPTPICFVYPSKLGGLKASDNFRTFFHSLTLLWGLSIVALLYQFPKTSPELLLCSLLYVMYYFRVSISQNAKRKH